MAQQWIRKVFRDVIEEEFPNVSENLNLKIQRHTVYTRKS